VVAAVAAAAAGAYVWSRLQVAGAPPEGRAFHTSTELATHGGTRRTLLVYGGFGRLT